MAKQAYVQLFSRRRLFVFTESDITTPPYASFTKYHDCPASEDGRHTARAQQGGPGPHFSQRQLYVIPSALCDEIAAWAEALGA